MSPSQQTLLMLDWFIKNGVILFDVHLRIPKIREAEYRSADWIWLTEHEKISYEDVYMKLGNWLRYQNSQGADVFFRPHATVSHPVLFLDDVPIKKAFGVSERYSACVIETSSGNTQIWMLADRNLSKDERKNAQTYLSKLGYSDPGSVSGNHLGRLCGFKSQKRKCWVNLVRASSRSRYHPIIKNTSLPLGGLCASENILKKAHSSPSEREFGWVLGRLRSGVPLNRIEEDLLQASRQRGKRNPKVYTERTLKNARSMIDQL